MNFEFWFEPYADEDTTLNSWIDNISRHMNWNLFKNQGDYVYMSGELGEGRFPQFKDEISVYRAYKEAFDEQMSSLFSYLFVRKVLEMHLYSNVDLGSMESYLREEMGNEEFEEWEAEAKRRIYGEYADKLGEESAKKIFSKAWPGWEK